MNKTTAALSALSEPLTVGTRVEDAAARPGTVTDVEPATNDVQVQWDHRDSTEWVGAEFVLTHRAAHAFDPQYVTNLRLALEDGTR